MIRLVDLLRDPDYRKWFTTVPTIRVEHHTPPWRLFVQQEEGGRWARVDLPSYPKAYAGVKSRLQECFDMTIHCKPQGFRPPIVEISGKRSYIPVPDGHHWCVYCRRPTVFKFFSKHPNMPKIVIADYEERCTICGARKSGMKLYKTRMPWDEYRALRSLRSD